MQVRRRCGAGGGSVGGDRAQACPGRAMRPSDAAGLLVNESAVEEAKRAVRQGYVFLVSVGDRNEEAAKRLESFGEVGKGEYGTYYIGYSRSPAVTEKMLENMFIGDPPGNTDRILEFSTALTGCLFFTPIVDFLNDPPPLPGAAGAAAPPAPTTSSDGSLAIGSLKGRP